MNTIGPSLPLLRGARAIAPCKAVYGLLTDTAPHRGVCRLLLLLLHASPLCLQQSMMRWGSTSEALQLCDGERDHQGRVGYLGRLVHLHGSLPGLIYPPVVPPWQPLFPSGITMWSSGTRCSQHHSHSCDGLQGGFRRDVGLLRSVIDRFDFSLLAACSNSPSVPLLTSIRSRRPASTTTSFNDAHYHRKCGNALHNCQD